MTTEELVKQICKEQGISVAKLAAALGQSRQNFYKKLQRDTLTAQEWQEAAKVLGVEFDQGFVLPDGTRMGVSEKREKRTVLPLMGSAFLPGKAEETVKQFEDPKLQEIARGELYFFRAQAESCIQSVEKYQTSEDPILRLSADMLSTFANFTLGNGREAQMARKDVAQILRKYMEKEEVLNRIAVKPQHRSPFKYGSSEVSNDDAIEIMNQLLNTVDVLIEIGDDTENWDERKKWINSVLNELWKARGPYPGFASAMVNMGLEELVQYYISITDEQDMKRFREEVKELLEGERDDVSGHIISDLRKVRREYMLKEEEEQQLLMDILPRFDLSAK